MEEQDKGGGGEMGGVKEKGTRKEEGEGLSLA